MSKIKWLDNLLFVETLLGIHRNYCNQKKTKKTSIILKISFQIILNTIVICNKVYSMLKNGPDQVVVIYSAFVLSAYVNAMSSIATGISYSSTFISYYKCITRISDWFKDDKKLIKSQKKIYWVTIIIILSFIAFMVIRLVQILKTFTKLSDLIVVLTFAAQSIIRLTIVYQYLMLFVVIMIVVNLSDCLYSLILVGQESVGSCDVSSDEHCDVTREHIQVWVELYQDLVNCCKKVTLCLGHQYFFSLVLSTPNNVLMIYQIVYQIDLSIGYSTELKTVTLAIFTYGSVMLMPIVAGQLACNQGLKLQRILARLYNTMLIIDSGEAKAKLIKDFIRLIKKNPLEIKLVSKVPAGMYMLPIIITLAVNYVIVMLQFNHVI